MQRQLPKPAPLARPRRLLAAMPSGLPTSGACVLAAALVVTPVVTLRAILPPDGHRDGSLSPQIRAGATDGRHSPDPSAVPECAAGGGECPVPRGPTGQHPKAPTDGAAKQAAAKVTVPSPATPAAAAPHDRGADEETGSDASHPANDPEREHADERETGERDGEADRGPGDAESDREPGDGDGAPPAGRDDDGEHDPEGDD